MENVQREQSHVHLNPSALMPPPSTPLFISPLLLLLFFPPLHELLRVMCEGSRSPSMTERQKKKPKTEQYHWWGGNSRNDTYIDTSVSSTLKLEQWEKMMMTCRVSTCTHFCQSVVPPCQNLLLKTLFPLLTTADTLSGRCKYVIVLSPQIYSDKLVQLLPKLKSQNVSAKIYSLVNLCAMSSRAIQLGEIVDKTILSLSKSCCNVKDKMLWRQVKALCH